MGIYRDAVLRWQQMMREPLRCVFGAPATERQLASAEVALGCPIPAALRELYAEFDGVCYEADPWDGDASKGPHNVWVVLPCGLLEPGRREFLESGYAMEPGWSEEFARCVMFNPHENGARLFFLTDRGAWGVPPGVVGVWDHDGGPHNFNESLAVFLCR